MRTPRQCFLSAPWAQPICSTFISYPKAHTDLFLEAAMRLVHSQIAIAVAQVVSRIACAGMLSVIPRHRNRETTKRSQRL